MDIPPPSLYPRLKCTPRALISLALLAACACAHPQATSPALTPQQQRALLVQAKQAYYNLHTAGASGVVTAEALMTWDNHWATQDKTIPRPANPAALTAALKTVRFKTTFHTDNSIEAVPLNLPNLADPRDAAFQDAVVNRMAGALRVILQGWARYEIRAAFERPDLESSVADLGSHYAVTYRAPGVEENITMSRSFAIDDIRLKTMLDVSGTSRPRFSPTPAGLLVTGWETSVSGRVGLSISAAVTYADVQGIHLPNAIAATYKPSYPGAGITISLTNYHFRKL